MSPAASRSHRTRRAVAAVAAFLATVLTVSLGALPAAAASNEYLQLTKTVDRVENVAGDSYTFRIQVTCSEASCLDAELSDALGVFAGHELKNVELRGPDPSLTYVTEWTSDGTTSATAPAVIKADTALRVRFTQPTVSPTGVGIQSGQTFTAALTMAVPTNLTPGTDENLTNTAQVTATNSQPASDSAAIHVTAPITVDVVPGKTWTPATQPFAVGAASTITLTGRNAANVPADALVLQEPAQAPDGVATLHASNPFAIKDLDTFTVSAPAGCTAVQVDAYVRSGGTWSWVTGTPGPAASAGLPAGVTKADVGGLRVTCTDAVAVSGTLRAVVDVTQRETHRNDASDLSLTRHDLTNVASAAVTVAGRPTVSKTATAPHAVVPANLATTITKSFAPARISAGQSTTLTLTAAQLSDVAVSELRITDLGFFDTKVQFGGLKSAPGWPTGATDATAVYHFSDGSTADVVFAEGATPATPAPPAGTHVTGFEIVFTGSIAPNADPGRVVVAVDTPEGSVSNAVPRTNTATSTITATNGRTTQAQDDDTLTVMPAAIDVTLTKTVAPAGPLRPGDRAVVSLRSDLEVSSSYVTADTLTIADAWAGGAGEFWNGFNLVSLAPTQIPANTAVQVQVQTAPGTWLPPVHTAPAVAAASLLSLTGAQLTPGGASLSDVTGVRLVLENTQGFEESVTVIPYLVTTARSALRTGGPLPAAALANAATVGAEGETEAGTPLSDTDGKGVNVAVEPSPSGAGDVAIQKAWSDATVSAQSGQTRTTTLSWRVSDGLETVTISDPADPSGDVAQSVADAFDLQRIEPRTFSTTPFTNGWYLKYDTVTAVELYIGGTWQAVAPPSGGWMSSTGFKGHTLTAAQRRDATGARLVLAENVAARTAAATDAGYDPYAPAVGDGVASSTTDRTFLLTWKVREVRRSASTTWVTGTATYNHTTPGVVRNTAGITGQPIGGGAPVTDSDHDDITIVDAVPLVRIEKTVTPAGELLVPPTGTAASSYPTRRFTVTAWNDSVARASYLRITDPACSGVDVAPCHLADALADPFAASVDWLAPGGQESIFDRFDLTRVTMTVTRPTEIDNDTSVAWLLRHDPATGDVTTSSMSVTQLLAATPAQLADVVGVSVTMQGTDPTTTGGTITAGNKVALTLETRLRTHVRSTGDAQELRAGKAHPVDNHGYAQSYDPVLAPTVVAAGTATVSVPLSGGAIDVTASKSLSPTTIAAPARTTPVTVTLGATQGTSTISPAEVRLTDDIVTAPQFWDEFDLVGLGTITLPNGANRVRVDVHGPFGAGGASEWRTGTAATAAAVTLPVTGADVSRATGIRFVFSKADGTLFSSALPASRWNGMARFTVRLRDTTRSAGTPVAIAGADRTVPNTVTAIADRLTGEASDERAAAALLTLTEGTRRLAVDKLANEGTRTVDVGRAVPWDLTFRNNGTGILTVTELRDTLPTSLLWTGEAPVVMTDADGLMSDDVTIVQDGQDLVLTWPATGRTLKPGETVNVRVLLELQAGLTASQQAVNTMTVRTAETLAACTPLVGSRPVTGAWTADRTTCGSADHVSPTGGPNLFTVKGVRGAVTGAATPEGQECTPLLAATGGSYYRTPCIARSVVGGTDHWVLRAINGGTTNVEQLTIFDPLASADDTMIISGADRGSSYRPRVVPGSLSVSAPAGATVRTEVTATPTACADTWSGLLTGAVCEQSGETWTEVTPATDWDRVTGLRVSVDLRTTGARALQPGAFVDVTFQTVNALADSTFADGVPAGPAADDVVAWNQFGVKYRDEGQTAWKKIAPAKMGVQVLTGPLLVRKDVTGPAAAFAPDSFTADVSCTLGGAELDLGPMPVVLDDAGDHEHQIDGIPVGAQCAVEETGVLGAFGETTRSAGATVTITADATGGVVPAAQVAALTNTYAYSGLSVTKVVDTKADRGLATTFSFELSCTAAVSGKPVLFAGDPTLRFDLADGDTYTVPADTIPARAECELAEVSDGDADSVVVVGDGVTVTGAGTADVAIGVTPNAVTVTNAFDAGILAVTKKVDGAAAEHGTGPFGFTARCTYRGANVLDEKFDLVGGATRTFGTFPAGTTCVVAEVKTGGATRTALAPADGTVLIEAPQPGETVSTATVRATNTFDDTSLTIVKTIEGDLSAPGANGPFVVELACTLERDGTASPVAVPGGAERTLRAPSLTTTYEHLPVGATCVLTETGTGGATATRADVVIGGSITAATGTTIPVDGLATTTAPGEAEVQLVNHFDSITKDPQGDPDDPDDSADGPRPPARLPVTGAQIASLAALAALLLGAGGYLVSVRRRRGSHQV